MAWPKLRNPRPQASPAAADGTVPDGAAPQAPGGWQRWPGAGPSSAGTRPASPAAGPAPSPAPRPAPRPEGGGGRRGGAPAAEGGREGGPPDDAVTDADPTSAVPAPRPPPALAAVPDVPADAP